MSLHVLLTRTATRTEFAAAAASGSRTADCTREVLAERRRNAAASCAAGRRRATRRRARPPSRPRPFRVRAGDHGRPGLLLGRVELGDEVLPLHGQVLVGPRHVDLALVQVGAVLADHGHAQVKPPRMASVTACLMTCWVRSAAVQKLWSILRRCSISMNARPLS